MRAENTSVETGRELRPLTLGPPQQKDGDGVNQIKRRG